MSIHIALLFIFIYKLLAITLKTAAIIAVIFTAAVFLKRELVDCQCLILDLPLELRSLDLGRLYILQQLARPSLMLGAPAFLLLMEFLFQCAQLAAQGLALVLKYKHGVAVHTVV